MTDMTGDTEQGAMEALPPDANAKLREGLEKQRRWGEGLRRNARANFRAMEGALSIRSEEDWIRVSEESRKQYESGGVLLDRMGAGRILGPKVISSLTWLVAATT